MHTSTRDCRISEMNENSTKLSFELLSGPMDGMEFTPAGDVVTVGRDSGKDISLLLDVMVSRNHARITIYAGKCWLEDSGSKNGTLLEGRRIEAKTGLPVGAIFTVGMTEVRRNG